MTTLNLTLSKKWFDMIASGEKKEEYIELKPYWIKRLFLYPYIINSLNNASANVNFNIYSWDEKFYSNYDSYSFF